MSDITPERAWRTAVREIEALRAEYIVEHADLEPEVRAARFAVEYRARLDEASELSIACDEDRSHREREIVEAQRAAQRHLDERRFLETLALNDMFDYAPRKGQIMRVIHVPQALIEEAHASCPDGDTKALLGRVLEVVNEQESA